MKQKKLILFSILFVLSAGTCFRITGNAEIRPVEFLVIFVMGVCGGLLFHEVVLLLRKKN